MAKIKVKSLASLMSNEDGNSIDDLVVGKNFKTPPKKANRRKLTNTASTSTKKLKEPDEVIVQSAKKPTTRSSKKEPPPNQLRIDSYFKSASKAFQVQLPTVDELMQSHKKSCGKENNSGDAIKKPLRKIRRKRLFKDDDDTDDNKSIADINSYRSSDDFEPIKSKKDGKTVIPKKQVKRKATKTTPAAVEIIDLCLNSEDEELERKALKGEPVTPVKSAIKRDITTNVAMLSRDQRSNNASKSKRRTISAAVTPANSKLVTAATISEALTTARKRKSRPLPAYKIVKGTTFAVDAFQFGVIEGVTHYFLSHYHADHYIGLTRKFAMPLYTSKITANLIRAFIPIEEQYLHELELNMPVVINDVEVTALDANHCPGAVLFVFKLLTGKCILHTGDFRASPDMESEPIFWNNDIDIVYLDTTYISDKYAFCTQYESIQKGIELVSEFRKKHQGKRILYVCGSYVIGKEKFWHAIAEEFEMSKVWTEANRRKALDAMEIPEFQSLLCDNPHEAEMHIISMVTLNYKSLVEYFEAFEHEFDLLFAMRPSGWEKNAKPQYRGKINLVGVEYSEHSSHNEMKRFIMYLKPKEVISTVPYGHNLLHCPKVPDHWYKYEKLTGNQKNFQTSITSYIKLSAQKGEVCIERTSKARKAKPLPAEQLAVTETMQVSPQKSTTELFAIADLVEEERSSKAISIEDEGDYDGNELVVYNAAIKEPDDVVETDDDWLP